MKRIAFLCSGGGGNLRFIELCIRRKILPGFELSGVVADRNCRALQWAREAGCRTTLIDYDRNHPDELRRALIALQSNWAVTNIHKILDPDTLKLFPGFLNLHYSLLPAFAGGIGDVPVRQAIRSGLNETGTTVHRLTPQVDAGPIISQSRVPLSTGESLETVMDRVFRSGCMNLMNAFLLLEGDPPIGNEPIDPSFSPKCRVDRRLFDESFWRSLR